METVLENHKNERFNVCFSIFHRAAENENNRIQTEVEWFQLPYKIKIRKIRSSHRQYVKKLHLHVISKTKSRFISITSCK